MLQCSSANKGQTIARLLVGDKNLRRLYAIILACLGGFLCAYPVAVHGAALPCENPVRWLFRPTETLCVEILAEGWAVPGTVGAAALTFTPDGTLYFADSGGRRIARLISDQAGNFSPPETFLGDLPEMPYGLTYDGQRDRFYISGTRRIFAVSRTGVLTTLYESPSDGAGYGFGNVRIAPDGMLYVGMGVACETCPPDEAGDRGALLRLDPDHRGAPEVIARGLRHPFDLAWVGNSLYIADDLPAGVPAAMYQITLSGTPPYPLGEPFITLPPQSAPMGMMIYDGASFPALQGRLMVALAGSWNAPEIAGYEIISLDLATRRSERFLPVTGRTPSDAALIRTSFYPYRLTGLAIDGRGWLYIGVAQGKIYRIRFLG